jgi:N-acetylglucosaminyldiphosphoundecaprenol N-acetyl-beta-D-mannosaminyltransferase
MLAHLPQENIFKIPIFSGDRATLQQFLLQHLLKGKGLLTICTPNPEQLMLASRDEQFERDLQSSSINLPDGIGLVWAGKRTSKNPESFSERISGREMVSWLIDQAAKHEHAVFFVGGKEGVAKEAAKRLSARYLESHISAQTGATNIAHETMTEHQTILQVIEKVKPTIVLIAYGAPHQERWMIQNRKELEKRGVKIAMVVGGTLDLLAGRVKTPPPWTVALGIEWLWRLVQQPWRWKRQTALIEFALRILTKN